MTNEMKRVREAVQRTLKEALEVQEEEIVAQARIIDDLGAESIDLLDIRFRLEQALGIRITNEELSEAFGKMESAERFREGFTVEAMCEYLEHRLAAASE